VSAGPVAAGGKRRDAQCFDGPMQLNVLRLGVAPAAFQPRRRSSSALPNNRNAVAAFSPALADAVGLRSVKAQKCKHL